MPNEAMTNIYDRFDELWFAYSELLSRVEKLEKRLEVKE